MPKELTPMDAFLAYDIGGTKIQVGLVTSKGKTIAPERVPIQTQGGPKGFLKQVVELGRRTIENRPKSLTIRGVGIASAGPLHPARGVLLDPTNMSTQGLGWGQVAIVKAVSSALRLPTSLENDAAAAILAEAWIGGARGIENAMVLTLGTGLGTGMICNGELVRAGRGLHPEGGHVILRDGDKSAPCGCGLFGCAEALLSGANFEKRAAKKYAKFRGLKSREIAAIAREKKHRHSQEARKLFEAYSHHLAIAIQNYIVLYAPEVVLLAGSFASAHDCFLPKTKSLLPQLLKRRRKSIDMLPKIAVSKLDNLSGLLGAAFVAREKFLS